MNEHSKLEIVRHEANVRRDLRANLGDDLSAAGKKGAATREARILADLARTRQHVHALAPKAAELLEHVLDGGVSNVASDQLRVTVARDVLDRTIGRAPTELRVGPSEQTLEILQELDVASE